MSNTNTGGPSRPGKGQLDRELRDLMREDRELGERRKALAQGFRDWAEQARAFGEKAQGLAGSRQQAGDTGREG